MANTAFDHAPTITVPSSSTANGVVLWNGTTGKNFDNTKSQHLTFNGVLLDIQNDDSAASEIRLYCDTGNAHYQAIRGGQHSGATSYTMILPHVPPTASQVLTTASISSNVAILDWADAAAIVPTTITVADTTDTTAYVGLFESASGNLPPKTDGALLYNAGNGTLTTTQFVGGGVGVTGLNGSAITSGTVPVAQLGSSGTRNSSTFLNGANAWAAAGGVDTTGTPADNQIAIFTDSDTLEGDADFTWDGTKVDFPSGAYIKWANAGRLDFHTNGNIGIKLDGSGHMSYATGGYGGDHNFYAGNSGHGDGLQLQISAANDYVRVKEGAAMPSVTKGIAKAWVNFEGSGTATWPTRANQYYNFSGFTDNGPGDYVITIDDNMSAADYVVVCSSRNNNTAAQRGGTHIAGEPAVGSIAIYTTVEDGTTGVSDYTDNKDVSVVLFGAAG